ncbi:MAG: acetyl-CoA carboxylase carboxyltransferase subunit alpha [Pseudomonadota bacterium]|nr:acetyl-CoA carboxylase carboxyltransferase subunit alpha [Pseudomonadota bacterium]
MHTLDFEKPVTDLEAKIDELRHISDGGRVNIADEIGNLQDKVDKQLRGLYGKLTPAQKVQVARHPNRPHGLDYIHGLAEDFIPLAGDRAFGDDQAIIGGLGRIAGQACMLIGHERGNDTETRIKHNFGMAKPEGYRKAQRLMLLAERFRLPIVTFIDTAGAFPGVDAEARGQAEAIARSIETCLSVGVPLVACVIGEGGSGGAIAIAAGDRVLMLEHSIYSVISPEGCASILWRSGAHAAEAAAALRITAKDLLQLGIIDQIIPEPLGGAHRKPDEMIAKVGEVIAGELRELTGIDRKTLLAKRREKFLDMGKKISA